MKTELSDKEVATKKRLKALGHTLRSSNISHKAMLRAQIPDNLSLRKSKKLNMKWLLAPLSGVLAVFLVFVVTSNQSTTYVVDDTPIFYDDVSIDSLADQVIGESATGMSASYNRSLSRPWTKFVDKKDVAEYEEAFGTSLEEYKQFNVLMKDLDDKDRVQDLFTLYDGTVSQVNDTTNFFKITGTIHKSKINRFEERIEDLATHDRFYKSVGTGTSRTIDLMNAPTDEAKQKIQDNVDYVDVIVTLEKLPSLWSGSTYDIGRAIAGYDAHNLFQSVAIVLVFLFYFGTMLFAATFWIIIPVIYFAWKRKRSNASLRFMD